ncbi:MAG: hypothetical protein EOP48_09930 [Sphingobacteriales bacterium]|nr:MAG: hypothetical protein EOP48_09930 [Sphingobacteriales bacterium]
MTAFFRKYKWTFLYWVILMFFLLYFAPEQSKYYLDQDINQFKILYLIPALIWTFGLVAFGLFVFWLVKTRSARQSAIWFLSTVLAFAFIIFVFKTIFLGIALFANRQITTEKVIKKYQAYFNAGGDDSKNNFNAYDPSTKHISRDMKLINELYQPGLKQNDNLLLTMNRGVFGVAFSPDQFNDK